MKLTQAAQLTFVLVAAVTVYSFVSTARDGERRRICTPLCALSPTYAGVNRTAPDFELTSTDGVKVALSSYRGKVVLLNFWTKTCGPCLKELPSLAELGQILRKRDDIALLTVSTDESAEDVRATLASVLGSERPAFVTLVDPDAAVVREGFGTRLYPETWFIDGEGVIRARIDGARDWTSAAAVEFAKSLRDPQACSIEYSRGSPVGAFASLCQDYGGQRGAP